jgi:hypothetical protein
VRVVNVQIAMTPRLLADLVADSTIRPPLRRWEAGDEPPLVCIVNAGSEFEITTPVTICVGDRLDDTISVVVDGVSVEATGVHPPHLHGLVLALAEAHGQPA